MSFLLVVQECAFFFRAANRYLDRQEIAVRSCIPGPYSLELLPRDVVERLAGYFAVRAGEMEDLEESLQLSRDDYVMLNTAGAVLLRLQNEERLVQEVLCSVNPTRPPVHRWYDLTRLLLLDAIRRFESFRSEIEEKIPEDSNLPDCTGYFAFASELLLANRYASPEDLMCLGRYVELMAKFLGLIENYPRLIVEIDDESTFESFLAEFEEAEDDGEGEEEEEERFLQQTEWERQNQEGAYEPSAPRKPSWDDECSDQEDDIATFYIATQAARCLVSDVDAALGLFSSACVKVGSA